MRVYFKNLDAIRFIAAFLVVLHHAQFFKEESNVDVWKFMDGALAETGRMGVNLFFVLSGFLISYLLMKERQDTGTLNFRNFYIRRILRIWPLYFAFGLTMVLFAPYVLHMLGVAPDYGLATIITNLVFLLLFAVNIQLAFFPYNKGIVEISWSVCIEEQFYLVWPLLITLFRNRLKTLFILMLGIGFLSKLLCLVLPYFFPSLTTPQLFGINYVLLFDKLELFGTGMFAAYLLFHKESYKKLFSILMNKVVQLVVLVITFLFVFSVIKIEALSNTYFDHFIHAVLFGYMMLMAVAPNSILHLEQPLFKTLGKVSYGIYLFHTPVCQLVLIVFLKFFGRTPDVIIYEISYPLACLVLTCAVAYVSYEMFEKRFLKIKTRYAVVQTRL
ncbi:acyltransferase family protein [Chitinophaga sp. GCM10012297]|uniref:Acyltransferase n=1 Tax=Chitinophaga chungangae TaxID=2821488 RepID=A0ABS3YHQ5_9BACT|nr:acyltransferase [Chitinophaga chungangae]MBO9154220.1 acyltransferase [Chitinophaga chungangae]